MATNKNALIRYKVLDKCFRNPGKRYFIDDLIAECEIVLMEIDPSTKGISRRQIFEDITFMESKEGWSIELERYREGKKVFYRYADISYSINNMPLNEMEIHQLKSAIDVLAQFSGMPQFKWINELLPKLQLGISNKIDTIQSIMFFDHNEYLKGIEHLGTLFNSITYKSVLIINYQPFADNSPFEIKFHPYFLKQFNNRWFVFGYNPENDKNDWNLAIDRISSITVVDDVYKENKTIDWLEYFDDIIGVTKPAGETLNKVILHFNLQTGKYIETKPLHGSQKSCWIDDETLEVKLDVVINYELEMLILSFGDTVVVRNPIELKEKIHQRLINASHKYLL
jgi:predicted DNA-binding transcriptional regulator YafY